MCKYVSRIQGTATVHTRCDAVLQLTLFFCALFFPALLSLVLRRGVHALKYRLEAHLCQPGPSQNKGKGLLHLSKFSINSNKTYLRPANRE